MRSFHTKKDILASHGRSLLYRELWRGRSIWTFMTWQRNLTIYCRTLQDTSDLPLLVQERADMLGKGLNRSRMLTYYFSMTHLKLPAMNSSLPGIAPFQPCKILKEKRLTADSQ